MSRLYSRNSRGRQPLLASTPRFSKSREHPNDTYQQPGDKRRKATGKYAITITQAKRKRVAASTASDTSSADSDADDDASDEDSESDDEEPAFIAPSRKVRIGEAGRKIGRHPLDDVSLPASTDSMFGDFDDYYENGEDPNLSPEENRKAFEKKIFAESDDDNDDLYKAVDDISDSDDEANLDEFEEQQLIASLSDDDENDGQSLYLNQIDGLSAYGFGDDSDGTVHFPPSSQGDDSATEVGPERRVRFEIEGAATYRIGLSDSPTIARALLPSALPDPSGVFGGPAAAPPAEHGHGPLLNDDDDDSDLTDDCLPDEAHHSTPAALLRQVDDVDTPTRNPPSPARKISRRSGQRRGPPRGVFIDDGDKASGILDASGKIMLITHPHLLGEEFAKRYGASQTSSPDLGFEELMDESDAGDAENRDAAELMGVPSADIMLASLNSMNSDPAYLGQATGPQEAFFPADGFEIGDYRIDPDDLEENFNPDAELGEDVIDIHDVLEFEDDSDDSDSPTSPIYMPPNRTMTGLGNVNNEFSHLTNENVTAFRRNADPNFTAFSNIPAFPDFSVFTTPNSRRKRKANESPYTSSHYKGVTPIQRRRDPASSQTPETVAPSKRRRIMT